MAIKRFAEYKMMGNPNIAERYRKSLQRYTDHTLLICAFCYAM